MTYPVTTVTERDKLIASVRAKLCKPNADVRFRNDNVEIFGYPVAGQNPQWYFVGTIKDFVPIPRPIHRIADDIIDRWPNVYHGAVPYLTVMRDLTSIKDMYGQDSAESIVNYFLANANTFRGEDARRLKAELKALL